MTISTTKSAFWKGMRDSAPFMLVSGPFGLLFGILASDAGLKAWEALAFSLSIYAGSAQFTALQLMQEQAPLAVVLLSALAVNLRVAMYSASLTPYLGAAPLWQRAVAAYFTVDQAYALSIVEYERRNEWDISERLAYFFGTNGLIAPVWCTATIIGALVGAQVPDSWGLDFVLPLAFLAMVGPMLRTPAHMIACFTACVVSLPASLMPYNLGLMVAGIAGMMAGAQAELWLDKAIPTEPEAAHE